MRYALFPNGGNLDIVRHARRQRIGTICKLRIIFAMRKKATEQAILLRILAQKWLRLPRSVTAIGSLGRGPRPAPGDPAAVQRRFTHGVFMKLKNVKGGRLEELKNLKLVLAAAIDGYSDPKALPQLAKQYRETVREIEEIEGAANSEDEICEILGERAADGKSSAVRKSRT